MRYIEIIINNHKCKFKGDERIITLLREKTRLRSPGYFYSPAWRSRQWDGYVNFITAAGYFMTGLLPRVLDEIKKLNKQVTVELEDNREHFKPIKEILTVGELTLRDYQLGAINSIKENMIAGLKFPRGILYEATNAGKSLVAAALHKSYNSKRVSILLINNTEIYKQLVEEIGALLGKDIVGVVNRDIIRWRKFNICMVQTLCNRLKTNPKIKADVAAADIVMVDEADEVVNRKDCQTILHCAYQAPVRIALTGSALKNKNEIKNQKLIEFFGPVLHKTTNLELIAQGVSTKPIITFFAGNRLKLETDYQTEYVQGIIRNEHRHARVWKRVAKRIEQGRFPILILVRYREHIRRLKKSRPKELDNYKVAAVHGETANRDSILKRFKEGKIDILIASMIIKRGKNLPTIRTLINAAGGDSEATVIQILGRALRSHKSKKKVYMDEFFDEGKYLKAHSRHRIRFYKNDGHEVREPYKKLISKYNRLL